ncbi:MAG: hypothetical protein IT165_33280 [Bryobacterales bacterium]|nr:hypothetical protein [Bryobacterales bacterium]
MPSSLIYATVLTCDRVIIEKDDDTASAIRMIDILFVPPKEEVPDAAVLLSILAIARFVEPEPTEHKFQFQLERPSGELKFIGEPVRAREPGKYENTPSGISMRLQLPIAAREMGIHWMHLWVDDEKVASAPFTLLPAPARKAEDPKQHESARESGKRLKILDAEREAFSECSNGLARGSWILTAQFTAVDCTGGTETPTIFEFASSHMPAKGRMAAAISRNRLG